ncbi:glycoside hydrolase family 76 protein [Patellaria atrata CBS 101060]|uniref:Mannan endo-1,6-alpha-mannosidase n=1 Tax=Patellaria atrata CBS 101060 TaxID=1346257 RepID=A0A9P4VNK2_9PEZI|nr:glycoside hydrolase family 76 protein [Patellaria atrata CBS 101060]
MKLRSLASAALLGMSAVKGIDLDLGSDDSIKKAASEVAYGMVKYYTGNNTGDVPGNLPDPYYWWEAGAMFGSLVDYWYYTGDETYNEITKQAMLFQVGPNNDYMPPNQSRTLGNDDQAFWGLAALQAAEVNFPSPPDDQPDWLALAQAVVHTQIPRWDNSTCGGGLKWQIFTFNNGYNYKNTISNGCFFNMAARLAKYTGNQTYAEWATRAFEWTQNVGLMNERWHFFDGSDDLINCTRVNHIQWSYNAGVYLLGAATMWNITESDVWRQRTQGILEGTSVFFKDNTNVMFEVACEPNGKCDVDQRSFKAYLARWMAATTKVAPWTRDYIMPKLQASATNAALQCSGGDDGKQCGLRWTNAAAFDGSVGVGEQMSALEVIQANLIDKVSGPLTNRTGGRSRGDNNAGSQSETTPLKFNEITTGDKAGAGILTAFALAAICGGAWWLVH